MENTNASRRCATLYSVSFKGLFGRNRTVKFWSSNANTEFPAVENEDPSAELTRLNAFIYDLADGALAEIKAKRGIVRVVRYAGCEINNHGDGVTTYTIPITQGVVVHQAEIGA